MEPSRSTHSTTTFSMFANTCLLYLSFTLVLPFGCRKSGASEAPSEAPQAVETVPARQGALNQEVRLVGQIHSRDEIRVIARTAGTLMRLPVTEGGQAEKGDTLAELDAPELGARLQRINGEYGKASIDAAHVCRQADQDRALLASGAVTAQKAETSREACRAARSGVNAAAAALREQTILAGKVTEKAPFAGTVLRWHARPGENVMPGQPLVTLGGPALEIRVPVPEPDLAKGIREGTRVELTFPDNSRSEALVREVAPDAVGAAHTSEARIDAPAPLPFVRHGQTVTVKFRLDSVSAWILPASALRGDDAGRWVFVVRNQALERREVFLRISARGRVAVDGPLQTDEQVVVDRITHLRDGLPVWPVQAKPLEGETP